jgi:prepilin-type N-terminal cleavage/methylation domain-containing protein
MISRSILALPPINMTRRQGVSLPRSASFAALQGFTLIEMAVVVVIISMLLSLGLSALNAQLLSAAHGETKKRQALINDALTAYLGANKHLPCPDIPNNTNGVGDASQVTGSEDRTGGVATGACSGNIGVVPYATLGLGREAALDGWGNFMSYSLPAGSGTCPGTGVDWSRTACFGSAKTSAYSLFDGTVAAPVLAASNVLAVVISHGPNGFAAWGRQGSRNVLPLRCEEAHNAIATVSGCTLTANAFYKGDRTDVDDVLTPLSRDAAINALAMQGTLKSSEGQVVEDLARIRSDKLYVKAVTNGCALSVGGTTDLDPWGNPYRIVEGSNASNLIPICICSTRGSGSPPPAPAPNSACSPAAPATCIQINESEVNLLRLQMGLATC